MVYGFADRSGNDPTWKEMEHSILRNFGGLDNVEPVEVFRRNLNMDEAVSVIPLVPGDNFTDIRNWWFMALCFLQITDHDPDCSATGLIQACLHGDGLNRSVFCDVEQRCATSKHTRVRIQGNSDLFAAS